MDSQDSLKTTTDLSDAIDLTEEVHTALSNNNIEHLAQIVSGEDESLDRWIEIREFEIEGRELGTDPQQELVFKKCIFHSLNFFKAKIKVPIRFVNCSFLGSFRLNHCEFDSNCIFSGCKFKENVAFGFAKFNGFAFFSDNRFQAQVGFQQASFRSRSSFGNSVFESHALFDGAEFEKATSFDDCVFNATADFSKTKFLEDVSFRSFQEKIKGVFTLEAYFAHTSFLGRVEFQNWSFDSVVFNRTNFDKEAIFVNVDLSHALFTYVDLDHNIYFYNVVWGQERNRLVLKEEFSSENDDTRFGVRQANKHYSELVSYYDNKRDVKTSEKFYLSEMTTRKKLAKWYERPLYSLYYSTSKYGTSWTRALTVFLLYLLLVCPFVLGLSQLWANDWVLSHGLVFGSLKLSVQALLLHREYYQSIPEAQFFLRAICQLFLIAQAALVLLAVRRNFRRNGAPSS